MMQWIANWPSTHVNLATGWALFVGTVLLGWVALVFDLNINESLYVTLIIATGAWAGVAAPAALVGKRATTKPELTVTVKEAGPPAKETTTSVIGPLAESEATETAAVVVERPPALDQGEQ